jgi:hypothetical protein
MGMSHPFRAAFVAASALLVSFAARPTQAAVITFSGLNNGVNTATDPENTTTGQAIPSSYQPLMNAYPAPGGNTDGGNIGVTISYLNSFVAAKASNSGVNEHTHQVTPTDTANENLYDNGTNPITLTFDQQVSVPSFYYAFFGAATYSVTFSAYTNAADPTPVVTYNAGPTAVGSYAWTQVTQFGTTPIQKITFSRSAQYLQLDDITVNAVPEPSVLGLIGGAAMFLLRRRRSTI